MCFKIYSGKTMHGGIEDIVKRKHLHIGSLENIYIYSVFM